MKRSPPLLLCRVISIFRLICFETGNTSLCIGRFQCAKHIILQAGPKQKIIQDTISEAFPSELLEMVKKCPSYLYWNVDYERIEIPVRE